jgi:ubiquinone/menaquinone biosynthesis C-methylase UbiE
MLPSGDIAACTEAEIQVLIALLELAKPKETPNNNFYAFYPQTLDQAATYFRRFREDWAEAYAGLVARGLLVQEGSAHRLTERGTAVAQRLRDARPPIYYWYQEYFSEAPHSPDYARFCELLYGRYLCQAGFSDMAQLQALLDTVRLGTHSRALDLGCGVGLIAEYISDVTGARVWGLDYSPEAIAQAHARTRDKEQRLSFQVGNLDDLPYPPRAFDTLIAIDTLYMPNDLDHTLAQMHELLVPGGQMALFYQHMLWGDQESREALRAEQTPLGQALQRAGLPFGVQDFTAATYRLLQRKRQIAEAMKAGFQAEGRLFLYEHLIAESESSTTPFDPQSCRMSRYLYHVRV